MKGFRGFRGFRGFKGFRVVRVVGFRVWGFRALGLEV